MSDLYFIRAGHSAVKIGHSGNVWQRIVNMQTNNHEELDCIFRLPGRGAEEELWQRAFAADRIHGEWFRWTPEVEEAIAAIREGRGMWWERLFPPDDLISDWTVDQLDDPDGFEEAYTDCVWQWRNDIANQFYRLNRNERYQ